jgi:large subunit ribosomal protein L4
MAAPKAPVLQAGEGETGSVDLEAAIFAGEPKPHLVHEMVRAELNARRAGTRGAKSRSDVSGGRSKPWRQKGTGRARAGTIRAPQFTGGGAAFPPGPRSFELKVNRKERRRAFRTALSAHASAGTFGVLDAASFGESPSTQRAYELLGLWGKELPLVVVAGPGEDVVAKSFRNIAWVAVTTPAELEVSALVWANCLLVTEGALADVQRKAAA